VEKRRVCSGVGYSCICGRKVGAPSLWARCVVVPLLPCRTWSAILRCFSCQWEDGGALPSAQMLDDSLLDCTFVHIHVLC